MNKLEKALVAVKIIFSLFISYLVIFKGDAGSLVHAIGSYLTGGNCIIGLISTVTVLLVYPLLLHNIVLNVSSLVGLKNKLMIFDIFLVFINLILGVFLSVQLYNMPMDSAQYQFLELTAGTSVLYFFTTILLLLILKKTIYKNSIQTTRDIKANNNIFSFTGKIARLPYFITKIFLSMVALTPVACKSFGYQFDDMQFLLFEYLIFQIVFILALYTATKRLRDAGLSQWLLIIWVIPIVGSVIGIPLLIVKSKLSTSQEQQS